MRRQGTLAQVGTFCPNAECACYQQVGQGNMIRYGTSRQGQPRYHCKVCHHTFNARAGTLFYRKRTDVKDIVETLAMVAEGMGIRASARVKGVKPGTVLAWLREAAAHAQQIEEVLLRDYELTASQIDALWTYVRRKGEKNGG